MCYCKSNQIYLEPQIPVSASEGFTIGRFVNLSDIPLLGLDRCAIDATYEEKTKKISTLKVRGLCICFHESYH